MEIKHADCEKCLRQVIVLRKTKREAVRMGIGSGDGVA